MDELAAGGHEEPVMESVPAFLGPLIAIDLRPTEDEIARRRLERSRFDARLRRLPVELTDFTLPAQTQRNWCWAAVGTALERFFRLGATHSQCELAQAVLSPAATCCSQPGHPSCNRVALISDLLRFLGITRRQDPPQPTTPVPFESIAADLAARRPVICLMTHRSTGVTHFMVLVGADRRAGVDWVAFDDPAVGGRYWRPLAVFQQNFNGWFWEQSTRLAR